jgi:hypothetical protein
MRVKLSLVGVWVSVCLSVCLSVEVAHFLTSKVRPCRTLKTDIKITQFESTI